MTKNHQEQTNNRLLYRFLQMAYEHIHSSIDDSLQGNRSDFYNNLNKRRLTQVFGTDLLDEENTHKSNFDEWFRDQLAKKASDIITAQLRDVSIGGDGAQLSSDQIDQRYQSYLKNLVAVGELGTDSYATYLPLHFFFKGFEVDDSWGIYISESGILDLASALHHRFNRQAHLLPDQKGQTHFGQCLDLAYQILLRHELEHFKIESFALNAELYLGKRVYADYLEHVYALSYPDVDCMEEAMANASVLHSQVIRKFLKAMFDEDWRRGHTIMSEVLLENQPPCYRNVDLQNGWPIESGVFTNKVAGQTTKNDFVGSGKRKISFNSYRRLAMNYLCNQILSGELIPQNQEIPFFAYPPDNYFLRAENLVPIHIVKTLSDEQSFIQFATPKKRNWEKFLKALGYEKTNLGKGDHEVWVNPPNFPKITTNYIKNELDQNAFKSSLKNLGLRIKDYYDFQRHHRTPTLKPVITET